MSYPHIIWTMQRTGGTTLAVLLSDVSDFPKLEHEPFNTDRTLHWVVQSWNETQDPDLLESNLRTALSARPVLKHCHELILPEINRALIKVTSALGYRHLILERRAETDRILSLELAKLTGAWGSKDAKTIYQAIARGEKNIAPIDLAQALHHMMVCQTKRQQLNTLFGEIGQRPHVVFFEDIYDDAQAGRQRVGEIMTFLKIDVFKHPRYKELLDNALLKQGQNSAQIMDQVPNIGEARDALNAHFQTFSYS